MTRIERVARGSAMLGIGAGLAAQYGSLAVFDLVWLWPLALVAAIVAASLRTVLALKREDSSRSLSARGAVWLGVAVLSLVLQSHREDRATGGLNSGVRDGQHVLLNHGKVSRRLSRDEYLRAFQAERALFAAYAVLFAVASLVAGSAKGSRGDRPTGRP